MTAHRHHPAHWFVIVLLPALTECSAPMPADRPVADNLVTGRIWGLRDLKGMRIAASDPEAATLRFLPDYGIAGSASCNHVGGPEHNWSADASATAGTFGHDPSQPTIRTLVGCMDIRATETGNRFWDMMATARGWSVASGTLTIRFADDSRAAFVPVGKPRPRRDDCNDTASRNFDCRILLMGKGDDGMNRRAIERTVVGVLVAGFAIGTLTHTLHLVTVGNDREQDDCPRCPSLAPVHYGAQMSVGFRTPVAVRIFRTIGLWEAESRGLSSNGTENLHKVVSCCFSKMPWFDVRPTDCGKRGADHPLISHLPVQKPMIDKPLPEYLSSAVRRSACGSFLFRCYSLPDDRPYVGNGYQSSRCALLGAATAHCMQLTASVCSGFMGGMGYLCPQLR